MDCDAVQSYGKIPTFQTTCCLHLQGEVNIEAVWVSGMMIPYHNTKRRHNTEDLDLNLNHVQKSTYRELNGSEMEVNGKLHAPAPLLPG
jgi:surfactin synthase thioesterase subunit